MNKKIYSILMTMIFVVIALFFGQKTTKAAGTYNYSFNVEFCNADNTDWEFSNYDALEPIQLFTHTGEEAIQGVSYTYEWSNGATGNGTTDAQGKIELNSSSTSASKSVSISLTGLENEVDVRLPLVKKNLYSKGTIDGADLAYYTDYNSHAQPYNVKTVSDAGTSNIKLYKPANPVKLNVHFYHKDGSDWTLQKNNYLPAGFIEITGGQDSMDSYQKDAQYIECNFSSGNKINYYNFISDIQTALNSPEESNHPVAWLKSRSEAQAAAISGSHSIQMNVYGVEDTDKLTVHSSNKNDFSKITVNGEEITSAQAFDLQGVEEMTINYYMPETSTGTVCAYSYDGSISDNYIYNFFFAVQAYSSYGNQDMNDIYWTVEGDSTKHYPIHTGEAYKGDYIISVAAPIGKKVTLHGIPVNNGAHLADEWVYGDLTGAVNTYSNVVYGLTRNGDLVSSEELDSMNIIKKKFSNFKFEESETGNEKNYVFTSGGFFLEDGFEIKHYIFRKNTQLMFKKEVSESSVAKEQNKEFHYRVKLVDPLTNKALKGRVAYYIYSNGEATADENQDTKYADIDANGYIDIYLKDGEYVRLGKCLTNSELSAKQLRARLDNRPLTEIALDNGNVVNGDILQAYFDDLGMLPLGVKYSIEEIDDDYSYTVDAEGSENGVGSVDRAGYPENIGITAAEWYEKLEGFKFVNTRKTGSLVIKKIVEGEETNEKFTFKIKIKDDGEDFPLEFEYEKEDGTTGIIDFSTGNKLLENNKEYTAEVILKAGEQITIKGIPAGAEYTVVEDELSSQGYTAEITNCTGKIKANGAEEVTTVTVINKKSDEEKSESNKKIKTGDEIIKRAVVLIIAVAILGGTIIAKVRIKK